MFYVYAIYNRDANKIYIGQTENLYLRLSQHNNKENRKSYTYRYDGTWEIIYQELAASRTAALLREKQLKSFQGRKFVKSLIIPG